MSITNQCILAIGKTGTGKSFTGKAFGAQNIIIGPSADSKVNEVTVHDIGNGSLYIDTPGFDDSDKDDETKRLILRTIFDKDIPNITTILWFTDPNNGATVSWEREAKFIESLADNYTGNVWDNTIIVTKGDKIENGPREAAKTVAIEKYEERHKESLNGEHDLLAKTGDFAIQLFESLPTDSDVSETDLSSDELNERHIFKESEPERILVGYKSLMEEHPSHPIKLNFVKVRCSKCPEYTDPRLAVPECHTEAEFSHGATENIHRGEIIHEHSDNLQDYHSGSLTAYHPDSCTSVHPGKLNDNKLDRSFGAWAVRLLTFGGVSWKISGCWDCCQSKSNSEGCKKVYPCCKNDNEGCCQKYSCCDNGPNNSGCQKKYGCCNQPDTSEGCQTIYNHCKHNVDESPCSMICKECGKDSNTEGCKQQCKNCKNAQTENGCIITSHVFLPN
ncbi:3697_t:CDS:2 [Cetraspora pellucida]|uniref:3697_t:CDS:1 n=1 Tax=Cetraspora pellucida TaxID=1433469 RepID=A0ACA9KEB9_9GLOM|nr:3697_t:CDS:2 [Cetraspora pellucida]